MKAKDYSQEQNSKKEEKTEKVRSALLVYDLNKERALTTSVFGVDIAKISKKDVNLEEAEQKTTQEIAVSFVLTVKSQHSQEKSQGNITKLTLVATESAENALQIQMYNIRN